MKKHKALTSLEFRWRPNNLLDPGVRSVLYVKTECPLKELLFFGTLSFKRVGRRRWLSKLPESFFF